MNLRSAYELNLLTTQRPRTTLEAITTHPSSQRELEYLEIFDFFNYPRLNAISSNGLDPAPSSGAITVASLGDQTPTQGGGQQTPHSLRGAAPAFVIPNPESDWLVFKPPYE